MAWLLRVKVIKRQRSGVLMSCNPGEIRELEVANGDSLEVFGIRQAGDRSAVELATTGEANGLKLLARKDLSEKDPKWIDFVPTPKPKPKKDDPS